MPDLSSFFHQLRWSGCLSSSFLIFRLSRLKIVDPSPANDRSSFDPLNGCRTAPQAASNFDCKSWNFVADTFHEWNRAGGYEGYRYRRLLKTMQCTYAHDCSCKSLYTIFHRPDRSLISLSCIQTMTKSQRMHKEEQEIMWCENVSIRPDS